MSVSPGANVMPHCGSVSLLRAGGIGDESADSCEIRRQADGQATHSGCLPTENSALCSKLQPRTHGHAAAFTCEVSEYLRYDHRDAVFHATLEDRHRGTVKTERGPPWGSVREKRRSHTFMLRPRPPTGCLRSETVLCFKKFRKQTRFRLRWTIRKQMQNVYISFFIKTSDIWGHMYTYG